MEVARESAIDCRYSCVWNIQYKEFTQAIPSYTLNAAGLLGGKTAPTLTSATRRPFSSSVDLNPLDYRYTRTVSASPSVLVKTNNLPAVCTGQCGYTFDTFT